VDHSEYGVGFPVRNTLLEIEPGDKGSERLLTLRFHTFEGPVILISAFALTLTSTPEAKHDIYTNLTDAIKNIHCSEHLILPGNFKARVGADHNSWPSCLGSFGVGKINENGQRLLELCYYHGLCMTNSYF